MDIQKLAITFYRDFEREYFDVPKNSYLNYSPWDLKQKYGVFPSVNFSKKDPTAMIVHKNSKEGRELWLYEKDGNFKFQELECKKNGFDHNPPLLLYTEYIKEPTFMLYKSVGFGVTTKYFLVYAEKDNHIYLGWTKDIKKATVFSYSTGVDWSEYHSDLVSYQKKF